jgi:hypothetical protein
MITAPSSSSNSSSSTSSVSSNSSSSSSSSAARAAAPCSDPANDLISSEIFQAVLAVIGPVKAADLQKKVIEVLKRPREEIEEEDAPAAKRQKTVVAVASASAAELAGASAAAAAASSAINGSSDQTAPIPTPAPLSHAPAIAAPQVTAASRIELLVGKLIVQQIRSVEDLKISEAFDDVIRAQKEKEHQERIKDFSARKKVVLNYCVKAIVKAFEKSLEQESKTEARKEEALLVAAKIYMEEHIDDILEVLDKRIGVEIVDTTLAV